MGTTRSFYENDRNVITKENHINKLIEEIIIFHKQLEAERKKKRKGKESGTIQWMPPSDWIFPRQKIKKTIVHFKGKGLVIQMLKTMWLSFPREQKAHN